MAAVGAVSLSPQAAAAPALGVITGSVDDSTTGAAAPGICVYAYAVNGSEGLAAKVSTGAQYQATTIGDGTYEIEAPTGYYVVRFDPSCGGTVASPYAVQYFAGQLDFESANPVYASAVSPATAVDAHLVAGYSVSGTVTVPGGSSGAGGACVSANDAAGFAVNTAEATPNGAYEVSNLPAGSYHVYFDATCGRTQSSTYAPQYYDDQVVAGASRGVPVNADVAGINAQLVAGATVSGTVYAPGAANSTGICAYAIEPGGTVAERAVTDAAGGYVLADLAAQGYTIDFDPTCHLSQASNFGPQGYPKPLQLTPGQVVSGVDEVLPLVNGPAPAISQSSLARGKAYYRYGQTVKVTGGTGLGYPWHVSGLPRGLSAGSGVQFSDEDAAIEGTIYGLPQVSGTFQVTVTVTTSGMVPPLVASRTFKLVVAPATPLVSVPFTSARVVDKHLPVRVFCTYLACSGDAKLTTTKGVVLASGPYAIGKSASAVVPLELTPAGLRALAGAGEHPMYENLAVTVRGGTEVRATFRVS
jgi:hypothetical protein